MPDEKPDYVLMTLSRLEKSIETQGIDLQRVKNWLIVLMVLSVGAEVLSSLPVEALVGLIK